MSQFARLEGQLMVRTSKRLCARVTERFPTSSLAGVAANLVELARSSCDLAERWPRQTDSTRGQTRRGRAASSSRSSPCPSAPVTRQRRRLVFPSRCDSRHRVVA